MNDSHTCVILSVIRHAEGPLSYASVRSIFNPEERARQTVTTIESVRSRIPGARVVLVELGRQRRLPQNLEGLADRYVFLGGNVLVRWACDSKHKGLGEVVGLLCAGADIQRRGEYFFKLSGRYCLTEEFDLSQWDSQRFAVRSYGCAMSTRLYGFPRKLFRAWRQALWRSIPALLCGQGIEEVLPRFLPVGHLKCLDKLGVIGAVAPSGEILGE